MTETTTTETTTQVEGTQTEEGKTGNDQAQAFKRLQEENKKLKEAAKSTEETKTSTEETEESTIDPEVRKAVKAELKAELKTQTETASKMKEVLTKYPELEAHKADIQKYLSDESWEGVPVNDIVASAIGIDALLKMGSQMGADRFQQAAESESGGGNAQAKILTDEEKATKKWDDSLPDRYKAKKSNS